MLLKNKIFVDIFLKVCYNPAWRKIKMGKKDIFSFAFFICSYNNYINIDGNKQS